VTAPDGTVIGIAVGSLEGGQNLNFAIPIDYAKGMLTSNRAQPLSSFYEPEPEIENTPKSHNRTPSPPIATGVPQVSQQVGVWEGNVYFHTKDGRRVQISSSGLDSAPHLSQDGRSIVFVRRTPSLKIEWALGDTIENELWIADTAGRQPPRRVLIGHVGGYDRTGLVLCGFDSPQFSMDGKAIYFFSHVWASDGAIQVLNLDTGQVRFLFAGLGIEIIERGPYAGYLIGHKDVTKLFPGRTWEHWLLDPNGKDIEVIGVDEQAVKEFKNRWR
jgi:hypothetical protein